MPTHTGPCNYQSSVTLPDTLVCTKGCGSQHRLPVQAGQGAVHTPAMQQNQPLSHSTSVQYAPSTNPPNVGQYAGNAPPGGNPPPQYNAGYSNNNNRKRRQNNYSNGANRIKSKQTKHARTASAQHFQGYNNPQYQVDQQYSGYGPHTMAAPPLQNANVVQNQAFHGNSAHPITNSMPVPSPNMHAQQGPRSR